MYIKVKALDRRFKLAESAGRSIVLDPKQEGGFRPTELWLAGLSGCAYGTLLKAAEDRGYAVTGLSVEASEQTDERGDISAVRFAVAFEGEITAEQREELLVYVSENCKVLRTAHDRIRIQFTGWTEPEKACGEPGEACCI